MNQQLRKTRKEIALEWKQPNSRIRSREDMNPRDREHFDVARALAPSFSRSDFLLQYARMFSNRKEDSMQPSDYCFNTNNKGNLQHPRFLIAERRGQYSFVGLDGNGANGVAGIRFMPAVADRSEAAPISQNDDIEQLIKAIETDFPVVEADDYPIWAYPPPIQVIDCVLSLNRQYDSYVSPRIEALVARHGEIKECIELRALIGSFSSPGQFLILELDTNYEDRARILTEVLDRVIACGKNMQGATEIDRLRLWACKQRPEAHASFEVKGFAIAGFQYLRMLFGANTVKPDVHITRYVAIALGREVSELLAVHLLETAATKLSTLARHLDPKIWRKMSGSKPPA